MNVNCLQLQNSKQYSKKTSPDTNAPASYVSVL